jgi:hypothetical protein
MRTSLLLMAGGLLFGLGYLMGTTGGFSSARLAAQDQPAATTPAQGDELTDDARDKIKAAADALKAAMEALQLEQRYMPATKGVNSFAILTGRCNALADLESGAGVDPETYAALYVGLAADEIQEHIGFDAQGRLTYKGKRLALLSKNRLRTLYATRAAITGEELPGLPGSPEAAPATAAPAEKTE